jgi:hypothetical protein
MIASLTFLAPEFLISSAVSTVVKDEIFKGSSGYFVAVTTKGANVGVSSSAADANVKTQIGMLKQQPQRRVFFMKMTSQVPSPPSPTVHGRYGGTTRATPLCWPVSGLAKTTLSAFPVACSRHPVAM